MRDRKPFLCRIGLHRLTAGVTSTRRCLRCGLEKSTLWFGPKPYHFAKLADGYVECGYCSFRAGGTERDQINALMAHMKEAHHAG